MAKLESSSARTVKEMQASREAAIESIMSIFAKPYITLEHMGFEGYLVTEKGRVYLYDKGMLVTITCYGVGGVGIRKKGFYRMTDKEGTKKEVPRLKLVREFERIMAMEIEVLQAGGE